MYSRILSSCLQPVSYVSLILTAATGAGLLTLYNYIVAEKLQGNLIHARRLSQL